MPSLGIIASKDLVIGLSGAISFENLKHHIGIQTNFTMQVRGVEDDLSLYKLKETTLDLHEAITA